MNLRWAPCSRTEDLWSAVVNTSPTSFIYHYWHFSSVFDLPLSNLVFMHLKSFGSPHIKHSNVKLCKAIECSNFKAFCFSHFFLFNETSLTFSNACMRDLKEKCKKEKKKKREEKKKKKVHVKAPISRVF